MILIHQLAALILSGIACLFFFFLIAAKTVRYPADLSPDPDETKSDELESGEEEDEAEAVDQKGFHFIIQTNDADITYRVGSLSGLLLVIIFCLQYQIILTLLTNAQ